MITGIVCAAIAVWYVYSRCGKFNQIIYLFLCLSKKRPIYACKHLYISAQLKVLVQRTVMGGDGYVFGFITPKILLQAPSICKHNIVLPASSYLCELASSDRTLNKNYFLYLVAHR